MYWKRIIKKFFDSSWGFKFNFLVNNIILEKFFYLYYLLGVKILYRLSSWVVGVGKLDKDIWII